MTNKFAIAALLSTLSVPAFAAGINPGHEMQANLLKLDASQFSVAQLAQIDAEKTPADRAARIQLIRETTANGTYVPYTTGVVLGTGPNNS